MADNNHSNRREFLSPEGAFALRLPEGWRWEQDSEDGHYIFLSPQRSGTVLLSESMWDESRGPLALDKLLEDMPGTQRGVPVQCTLNGTPAARVTRISEDGTRRLRIRQWVVSDGRTVVYVTHEVNEDKADAEEAEVEQLLQTLEFRKAPHPVISTLLERVNRDDGPRWEWQQDDPMVIRCASTGQELSTETLVRAVDVNPSRWNEALEDLARKIRNLAVFSRTGADRASYARVAGSILPLIRGERLLEATEQGTEDGKLLARRPWGPDLYVYFALDVPGAFYFITHEVHQAWGVDVATLEATAVENLSARVAGDRLNFTGGEGSRLLLLEDGEGLASSRLLLSRFRRALDEALGTPWHVALPSAIVLIAFSAGYSAWRDSLGEDVLEAYLAEPIPVTPNVYRVGAEGVTLTPDTERV